MSIDILFDFKTLNPSVDFHQSVHGFCPQFDYIKEEIFTFEEDIIRVLYDALVSCIRMSIRFDGFVENHR